MNSSNTFTTVASVLVDKLPPTPNLVTVCSRAYKHKVNHERLEVEIKQVEGEYIFLKSFAILTLIK